MFFLKKLQVTSTEYVDASKVDSLSGDGGPPNSPMVVCLQQGAKVVKLPRKPRGA
jgi:hypothetical protein